MTDETRLSEELSRRAHDVHGSTLSFDDVRGRATRIRRRRATGAVVAAAAVVAAIIIPLSLSGSAGKGSAPEPAPSGPTHAVDPLEGGLPILQGDAIVYPDGRRIELRIDQGLTPDGFALLGSDRHVLTAQTGDGERAAVVVDDSGAETATYPLNGGLAVAPYGEAVAWMGPDNHPMLLRADDAEPQTLTELQASDPDGSTISDPNAVALTGDCDQICQVMVQFDVDEDWMSESWQIDTNEGGLLSKVEWVVDVSPAGGQVAGLDEEAPDGIHMCGGVFDDGDNEPRWGGCEDNVYDFSPDGTLVATTFAEGFGPNRFAIRDAQTGSELASIDTDAMFSDWAWEGDHLLVVETTEDGTSTVLQLDTDGTVDEVAGSTGGARLVLPTIA